MPPPGDQDAPVAAASRREGKGLPFSEYRLGHLTRTRPYPRATRRRRATRATCPRAAGTRCSPGPTGGPVSLILLRPGALPPQRFTALPGEGDRRPGPRAERPCAARAGATAVLTATRIPAVLGSRQWAGQFRRRGRCAMHELVRPFLVLAVLVLALARQPSPDQCRAPAGDTDLTREGATGECDPRAPPSLPYQTQ